MTKYARNIGDIAADVVDTDPAGLFHASLASTFIEVPDDVENGWVYANDTWSAPVAPAPETAPTQHIFTRAAFMLVLWTFPERVAISTAIDGGDLLLKQAMADLDQVENVDVQNDLVVFMAAHCVTQTILTQPRADRILAGLAPAAI